MKLMYKPLSVLSGLVAGIMARRLFRLVWRLVDDGEPPRPEHRRVPVWKLALALGLEGVLAALIRGLIDHGSRRVFTYFTGEWPGEEEPEPR
jgi:hypothetical protein